MDYRVNDETFTVAIASGAEGREKITLTPGEGEATNLDCRLTPVGGHAYLFEAGDRRFLAHAVKGELGWYVNLGGQQLLVVPPEILEQDRRRGAQVDAETHVSPPMPGQVIKILVEVDDEVEAGQQVVVISAMKMETALAAPHGGKVTAINTEVGAQVMPGDVLIDIEEA